MTDAPEIKVRLSAEDTGVAAAIKELGSQLKSLKTTQDETAGSAIRLKDAFKGLIGAIVVGRLLEFGKEAFESGVNIARMTQMTGASAGTISAAYYKASEELGIGTEVVDKAFVRLSKSIIEFQQGSSIATKAFGQLGITTKNFVGLNTDQKIRLVTDRLGEMKEGTEKAGLAQLILSRSGAQALPVLNALAGEGFAKATEEAKRFGLYLDNEGANSMLQLKQSLGDIEGEAKGAALQFELGLIPALTKAVDAISAAGSGEGGGFKKFGEEMGSVIQHVVFDWVVLGAEVTKAGAETVAVWDYAMNHVESATKSAFAAVGGFISGGIAGAVSAGTAEIAKNKASQGLAQQLGEIDKQFEREKDKANLDVFGGAAATIFKPGKEPPGETADQATERHIREEQEADQLARAKLAREKSGNSGELELQQAGYKQQEQDLKDHYDRGLISTEEYYQKRKDMAAAGNAAETAYIQRQIVEQEALAARFHREALANRGKSREKGQSQQITTAYVEAAARDEQAEFAARTKIAELNQKISLNDVEAKTKSKALDTEEFAKKKENQKTLLGFQEQILEAEGKTYQAALLKINQEAEEMALALTKAGGNPADAETLRKSRTGQAGFEDAASDTARGLKAFDIQKQSLQIQQKGGKLGRLAEEREINQLIAQRLPLLERQAQAELAAAQATGNQDDIAKAQNDIIQVQNLKAQTTSLSQQMRGPVSQSFTNFFETVGRGTMTVQRSFENLAGGIIAALQKVLMQKLMEKILGTDSSSSGGSGGGAGLGGLLGGLLGAFGHHAEGGLIRGRGGPKSDSIPAMLSNGEYIVNAAAVAAFGAHNLEAINRGMRIPSIEALAGRLPRFAEGGLVGPEHSEPSDIRLAVGLDHGLVLQHLSSKAAGRVILQHLVNNPKAAGKAMSRGA